jgi:2-oxoisovalerate dehydrogenase E2 component (dihydrolipoyl transacylase)
MALNIARAGREVVHATLHDQADVDAWSAVEDVTVRLIRALIAGCTAEPLLNASFDAQALALHRHQAIDLGLAIDSPDGLFVPVLRDVARSGPADWRRQIDAAKKAVADRSLTPADLRGPTITLSNFGTIAGVHANLIIMPPQVAIIGAGRMICHPTRPDQAHVSHQLLPISLTFDHRMITGGEAARCLRALIADLERPA